MLGGRKTVSARLNITARTTRTRAAIVSRSFSRKEAPDLIAGLLTCATLKKILPLWFRKVGEGRNYVVAVSGLESYATYVEFKKLLNSGEHGFFSAQEKVYMPGEVSFEVVFNGSLKRMVMALGRIRLMGKTVSVAQAQGNAIRLNVK